jgi:hypothetical protein
MKFVIRTQHLENYGAHDTDGKFASNNAYWKMKGGTDYIVEGVDRVQDAVAFVAAKTMQNNIAWKEFPTEWLTYDEWEAHVLETCDSEYAEFIFDSTVTLDPREAR